MKYTFVYDIKAISKDNEKIFNRSGCVYLSKQFKDYEYAIKMLTKQQITRLYPKFQIMDNDVRINLQFDFNDKRRRDLLNLPKSFCDALNGVIYNDDSQITSGEIFKNLGAETNKIVCTVEGT